MINNLTTIQLSKFFFVIYVLYTYVISYVISSIPGLSIGLLSLSLLLAIPRLTCIRMDKNTLALLYFNFYILITGSLIALEKDIALQTAFSFGKVLVSFYIITLYTRNDNNIDFSAKLFVLWGLFASLTLLFTGRESIRQSIADNVNSNDTGVVIMFALAFLLYEFIMTNKTVFNILGVSIIVLLFLYCIIQTVSKKAIIGAIVLIIIWLLLCFKMSFKKMNKYLRGALLILFFVGAYCAYNWYSFNFVDNYIYLQSRMNNIMEDVSTQSRWILINEGFVIFLNNPVLGVGFNNTSFYTSLATYTHCLYSELPACTGIIGTILFLFPLFNIWFALIQNIRINRINNAVIELIQAKYMLAIFIVMLILNSTQILFYMHSHVFALAIINGFCINYLKIPSK